MRNWSSAIQIFYFTMIKSMLFASIILFSSLILRGQNLVVNPSFEIANDSVSLIPPGEFSATKAMGWSMPTRAQATLYGSIPTIATTNRAFNRWKFTAKTGNNVIGIMTYGSILTDEKNELREYLQGTLTKALTVGQKYYVSYWVHFHCEGSNNLGVAFGKTPLSTDSVFRLPLKPNVINSTIVNYSNSTVWEEVRDSFIAREPYKYFIIGNFLSNKETKVQSNKYHYHKAYLDEIKVEEATDSKMPSRAFDVVVENESVVSNSNLKNNAQKNIEQNASSTTLSVLPRSARSDNSSVAMTKDQNSIDKSINNTSVANNSSSVSTPTASKPVTTTPSESAAPTAVKGEVLVLDKVLFQFNSATLEATSSAQLDKLVAYLQRNPSMKILIKGHTSSEGSEEYNQKLSENRSKSVVDYLISKNIGKERLTFKGFGKSQPIHTNGTEESRQQNRRVEFEIIE